MNMDTSDPPLTKEVNDAMHAKANGRGTQYIDTMSAYDRWSEVYDTDGNFLQALDNIEVEELLPRAISALSLAASDSLRSDLKAIDLGCGTGRNTVRLLDISQIREITAIDLSPKMLEIAKERVVTKAAQLDNGSRPSLNFEVRDVMVEAPVRPGENLSGADLVISTLVVEHVPLSIFFAAAARMLSPGGILLMTNMHPEMGNISQAGFVDPKTGDKIRPVSYAHTVEDTEAEAEKRGFELVRLYDGVGVKETKMTEDLVVKLGPRSRKWIGIDVWYGGIWRKRGAE